MADKSKATNYKRQFTAENYDRIEVTVPKGDKAKYKAHADKKDGGSLNGFVKRAMAETMQRDNDNTTAPDRAEQEENNL